MRFSGRVAVVTGGSRGIGKATALRLAGEGAKVVITSTTEEGSKKVADEIVKNGGEAIGVKCDVTNREDVKALMKTAFDTYGSLDILVNNAGVTRDSSFLKLTEDKWDAVLDTNLKAIYICCQEAIPYMKEKGYGRIVNLSSRAGQTGVFGQANYSASKAGVIGLTRALATEFAGKGITANVVAPGFTLTDMTNVVPEEVRNKKIKDIPVGRIGQPEDIAAAVAFLASEEAGFVCGVTLPVNGGAFIY